MAMAWHDLASNRLIGWQLVTLSLCRRQSSLLRWLKHHASVSQPHTVRAHVTWATHFLGGV